MGWLYAVWWVNVENNKNSLENYDINWTTIDAETEILTQQNQLQASCWNVTVLSLKVNNFKLVPN